MAAHARGFDKAPVTLVEFADFECPYCGKAFPVVEELRQRFGASLKIEFKNFPLTEMHPHAMLAAKAAEAASRQNKFWEMHDLLFQNQSALRYSDLVEYAGAIGLKIDRFETDFRDPAIEKKIADDVREGERYGIEGTPGFIINGELYDGEPDVPGLSAAIGRAQDEQLIRVAI